MKDPEETFEDQVFRVLKEMVDQGEVLMHEEDGEVLFSLAPEAVDLSTTNL